MTVNTNQFFGNGLMNGNNSKPIGIFDSGLGGLTVLKEVRKILPFEDLVYFGDTARVPYGNKSRETIVKYSVEIAEFLINKGVKAIIVACNTSSSLALDVLQSTFKIPVVGVIKPGARKAVEVSAGRSVAVIGTTATISSKAYSENIREEFRKSGRGDAMFQDNGFNADILEKPCPLFVPLVEEGFGPDNNSPAGREIAKLVVKYYLDPLIMHKPSCVVLGCTHYPIIKDLIAEVCGGDIDIIDSGIETAGFIKEYLEKEDMLNSSNIPGTDVFFVTDDPERFGRLGSRFLDNNIGKVNIVTNFI